MSPRRPMALKPVARAAHALARPVFKKYGLSEAAIAENWAEIVGPEWARVTAPRHFNRQSLTLTVKVAGARAPEFAHLEREIIQRINGFAGRELVRRLKIVQGPVGSAPRRAAPPRPLAPEAAAAIDARAGVVSDPGLKAALSALGRAIKSRVAP